MDSLIYRIHEKMPTLTKAQKRIALGLLDKPQEAIYYSTEVLALKCEVSHAAISRFCYLFNFYGLKDLQISLALELSLIDDETIISPESEDFSVNIAENVLGQTTFALKDTYKRLKKQEIKKAAELILHSQRIYLAGIGASNIVAQDLCQKLLRIEKDARIYAEYDLNRIALVQATANDILVLISYSGEKKEILQLAKQAKAKQLKILAIVKAGSSRLAEMADIVLNVAALEKDFRGSALTSRIVQLYVVDVIFHTCCAQLGATTMERLTTTFNVIRTDE